MTDLITVAAQFRERLELADYEGALRVVEASPLSRSPVAIALRESHRSMNALAHIVDGAIELERVEAERPVVALATVACVAPLVGLVAHELGIRAALPVGLGIAAFAVLAFGVVRERVHARAAIVRVLCALVVASVMARDGQG